MNAVRRFLAWILRRRDQGASVNVPSRAAARAKLREQDKRERAAIIAANRIVPLTRYTRRHIEKEARRIALGKGKGKR